MQKAVFSALVVMFPNGSYPYELPLPPDDAISWSVRSCPHHRSPERRRTGSLSRSVGLEAGLELVQETLQPRPHRDPVAPRIVVEVVLDLDQLL